MILHYTYRSKANLKCNITTQAKIIIITATTRRKKFVTNTLNTIQSLYNLNICIIQCTHTLAIFFTGLCWYCKQLDSAFDQQRGHPWHSQWGWPQYVWVEEKVTMHADNVHFIVSNAAITPTFSHAYNIRIWATHSVFKWWSSLGNRLLAL